MTITGNYRGTGGTVHLNAALGDDTATTDRLVINGNSLGTTTLAVNGIGSSGALTTDGIKVVDVMGTSDGTFTLDGDYTFRGDAAVVGGAYAYRLYAGSIDNPADGDWYLRSTLIDSDDPGPPIPLYQPGVPLYEAYANVLQSFNKLETMRQRVGNRTWSPGDAGVVQVDSPDGFTGGNGMWGRIDADRATYDVWSSTSGTNHADMTWRLQAGIDGIVSESEAGRLIGGISAEFGTISAAIASVYGTGAIASNAAGLGGTLTWYSQGGFYLDGQAKVTWYDSTLTSHTANLGLVSDNMGIGYGLSIEAGHKIALGSNWSLTPQAQLAYSSVGYADFTDVFGAAVSLENSRSIRGRLGVSADYEQAGTDVYGAASSTHLYGIVNVDYDFDGSSTTSVSGTSFANDNDPLWGTVGIGGSYNWGDNKYSIYGEATAATSLGAFGESFGFSATGGLRIRW